MKMQRARFFIVCVLLTLILGACGKDFQSTPTKPPTPTRKAATPVGMTVGELADRIATGWKTIDRYRSVTTTVSPGTPTAAGIGTTVIEEVILPDRRRQVVTVDGIERSEIVAAGGNVYGRGMSLPGIEQPNRNPDSWITINGNVLGPNNAFSGFYRSLLLPSQPPYAGLSQDKRDRPAVELGSVELDRKQCQQYRIVDTTLTGDRVVVVLALASDGLVCSIETTSDTSVSTTRFAYDQPVDIVLPASPVPAPVENG